MAAIATLNAKLGIGIVCPTFTKGHGFYKNCRIRVPKNYMLLFSRFSEILDVLLFRDREYIADINNCCSIFR